MLVYKPTEIPIPHFVDPTDGMVYRSPPAQPQNLSTILVGTGMLLFGLLGLADMFDSRSPRPAPRRPNNQPLSPADREYVSTRDGWRCTYCGKRLSRITRHIDHSVSRRNGGTNHLNNLRLACASCNLRKGHLNARQFVA